MSYLAIMLTFLSRLSESFWKTSWFRCPVCWSMQIIWHLLQGPKTWAVRREKSTIMKLTWLSHSAGSNLGPRGMVVNSQFQTLRETLQLQGAKSATSSQCPLGNHPPVFASWKTTAAGFCRKRKGWSWLTGGYQGMWGFLQERQALMAGLSGRRWPATLSVLLWWPQITWDLGK